MHKVYKKIYKYSGLVCLGSLTALDNFYLRLALMVATIILFNLTLNSEEG